MHLIIIAEIILVLLNTEAKSSTLLNTNSKYRPGRLPSISYQPLTNTPRKGKCVKFQCKYVCSNGIISNIKNDILAAGDYCKSINDLQLHNYEFFNKTLPKKLLGTIADKFYHLSIYSSDVEYIDDGAFESKTLVEVHLENMRLRTINKSIFKNINFKFSKFTLIQTKPELRNFNDSFLELIKYQIKKLIIRTGLNGVHNLTNTQCLLNNLEEVDLSYNNFEGRLTPHSFNQLSVVENLNLTNSAITYLPDLIFADIVGTLKFLDLSNNKLVVMSENVFGWRVSLTKDLSLLLNGNPWNCTCDLQKQMSTILKSQKEKVYCESPRNVYVTSPNLCLEESNDSPSGSEIISTSTLENLIISSPTTPAETVRPPTSQTRFNISHFYNYDTTYGLECHKDNAKTDTQNFGIHWPNAQFEIINKKGFEVDIVVTENLSSTYGVLWFSKVTMEYYKMEVNHNEYGLGCFGRLKHITTVRHLIPDMSYTFCLILKDRFTISPFSCKSTYIDGNLEIKYNAWLTTNMKATGISLVIIGIVMFKFLGILFVFLLIKKKPFLLKGSKRVATQKNDASNILVFSEDKTLQKFKLMEEQLAVKKQNRHPIQRTSSISAISLNSIQSYINPENFNIYEIIPAHQNNSDVRYAPVPFKRKRSSNDPLPEIPHKRVENKLPFLMKKMDISIDSMCNCDTSHYV